MHDRQLLRKHQYLHYVRSGQRGNFYDMPLLCLMIRSTWCFIVIVSFVLTFTLLSLFSDFYFDLSQPYYWRLAGVEKEKSPVKEFAQEKIYHISRLDYFHQPKRYFPCLDCFCQYLPVFWGTVSSMICTNIGLLYEC